MHMLPRTGPHFMFYSRVLPYINVCMYVHLRMKLTIDSGYFYSLLTSLLVHSNNS